MAMMMIPFAWEEAFDKHGFFDGDIGFIGTLVLAEIHEQGYQAEFEEIITSHNMVIGSVRNAEGYDYLRVDNSRWRLNGKDVRRLLPAELVAHLDGVFSDTAQIEML
jgi:hypothetical protein